MYNPNLLPDGLPPYQFKQDFADLFEEPVIRIKTVLKQAQFAENKHLIHFPEQNENNDEYAISEAE